MNIVAVTTQLSDEKSFILNVETNEKIELVREDTLEQTLGAHI